jgi:hypothetical protein
VQDTEHVGEDMYVCMYVCMYIVLLVNVEGKIRWRRGCRWRIILKEVEGIGCVWTEFMWFWVRAHSGMF